LRLSIEEDRVTYTDLVPSQAINAVSVTRDADGNIFIFTDMMQSFMAHQTMSDVFYIGLPRDGRRMYGIDEANTLYRVNFYGGWGELSIEAFRNRAWGAPVVPADGHVFLCFSINVAYHHIQDEYGFWFHKGYTQNQHLLLFDNWMVSIAGGVFVREFEIAGNALTLVPVWIPDPDNQYSQISNENQWALSGEMVPIFLGDNHQFLIRRTAQGQMFATDLREIANWEWSSEYMWQGGPFLGVQFEMMQIASLEIRGNEIIATHDTPFGAVEYRIFINAQGNIAYERYVERTINPNIIVILPLF